MTSAASAGTIKTYNFKQSGIEYIHYSGTVRAGDLKWLKLAYDRLIEQEGRKYVTLILDSPGGSGGEMKRIVKWMQDKEIHTRIGKDDECFSACAVIWTYGKYRTWDNKGETAIGFHIGSIGDGSFIANYIRDNGVKGVQRLIQFRALDDIYYYSRMPVKDPLLFVQWIAYAGYADYTFWKPTFQTLDNIVGYKYPQTKGIVVKTQ